MAIAKKPNSNRNASAPQDRDKAAEAFISGAGKPAETAPEKKSKREPVMVRFDADLLARVDAAAAHRGISRSAWIQFTCSRALDQGEG